MGIPGLTIIGESINDSVPSTHDLFQANDLDGIVELARFQAEKGAAYIDVNVGRRSPAFMAEVVKKIQQHVSVPLSIDTPDPEIASAGLEAYNPELAGNRLPILNSISEARLEIFNLYSKQPFMPILLITEGKNEFGEVVMNKTPEQNYTTARSLVKIARERIQGVANNQLIIDPGIAPIGSDMEGNFKRLMKVMEMIHQDPDLAGINMSVGLSNFTVMLPSKKADGSPVKSPLESAFLTLAMPLGLNFILGSVKRKYEILPDNHPAMQCLKNILASDGLNAVLQIMNFIA
ncbi:MAG TPA: dihydropteroate synthase [Candidatus Marinimicrobia bacterium]|nr:dihydropteroate synthase [Candidatus Neomarinimicrobiota bacterium]HRS50917.1 dihydropteroate synthase [Candidatus Neomarinimicrobiota bacterium]HRU91741.1 dihydropteroate synthase [Candidatus Neomarinimicrobiota bacterium]